ncbi:MAG TPA: hypothetical protein ENI82_05210 [Bacteroidetes bacterium]|nr:hypothetical protein [Bacteroidota bacterium]
MKKTKTKVLLVIHPYLTNIEQTHMKAYAILVACLLSFGVANAQVEKILHATFNIDTLETLSFDIAGEYHIEKWAGNMILAETVVKLYDANSHILDYFIKEGRYDLELKMENGITSLVSKNNRSHPIKTSKGECFEETFIKLLIPEDFNIENDKKIVRESKEEEEVPTTSTDGNSQFETPKELNNNNR